MILRCSKAASTMIRTGELDRSQGAIESYTSKYNDFGYPGASNGGRELLCITIAANIAEAGY